MTEKRYSIYAGAPLDAALSAIGARDDAGYSRSGRINSICERYMAMVADELARLDLTRGEWCAILDANNGVQAYTGGTEFPSLVWANVHDSPALGNKWEIDQPALVGRLQALPKSTLLAIQEACDRFWSRPELPTDEALAKAGVSPDG